MSATRNIASGTLLELIAHARSEGRLPEGTDLQVLDARSLLLFHSAGLVSQEEVESVIRARLERIAPQVPLAVQEASVHESSLQEAININEVRPPLPTGSRPSRVINGRARRRRKYGGPSTSMPSPGTALDEGSDPLRLIAKALGACPECWGRDAECQICSGNGHLGAIEPEPEAFQYFVHPALRRVAAKARDDPSLLKRPPSAPTTETENPHSQTRRFFHE